MNKAQVTDLQHGDLEDMLPEYSFDYQKARPNRFAPGVEEDSLIVVLEPEIAHVFKTSDSVKTVLRALIAAMPDRSAN
jgi:hypothetical protein